MRTPTTLASVGALLDRAREHISRDELPGLVMNDPGSFGYVRAYERVLLHGVAVLFEKRDEGLPFVASFDITENLLLSHTDASRSVTHRWFSVLTACLELLGAAVYRDVPLSATVGVLLEDTFALHSSTVSGAPLDLLPAVFRELEERSTPHERLLASLGVLLTAEIEDAEIEARCRNLAARHEEFQYPYDESGEPNPLYAPRPEFVWGAVIDRGDRASMRRWLQLVEAHFPASPEIARTTRERLLGEGSDWLRSKKKKD